MLVRDWMSTAVITAYDDDSLPDAIKLMKTHNIRILPVLKTGKLIGVVTDRDLKRASASNATSLEIHELLYLLSHVRMKEIMTRDPITVPYDFTIEETAQVLRKHKISGTPVLDGDGQLAGIITQTDVFDALVSLTGIAQKGLSFAFVVNDKPGSIKELADIVRESGGRMVSILSSYERAPAGYRRVYVRLHGVRGDELDAMINRFRERATVLYSVDHRENLRHIYQ